MISDCNSLFDSDTLDAIKSTATCSWIATTSENTYALSVALPSTATVNTNDNITIMTSEFSYTCQNDNASHLVLTDQTIPIKPPNSVNKPNIILVSINQIGRCDDLILDATSTTNTGNRDNTMYLWNITKTDGSEHDNINNTYIGNLITIPSDSLEKDRTYKIHLTVTTWYDEQEEAEYFVYVSNKAIPTVSIYGISELLPSNGEGVIGINSRIEFDVECVNTTSKSDKNKQKGEGKQKKGNDLVYDLQWTVNVTTEDYVIINEKKFNKLIGYLGHNNADSLLLDVDEYLQSGLSYSFNMDLECQGLYNCSVDASHQLFYQYADIECDITPNNIIFEDMDPEIDFDGFLLELNGKTFTYDPADERNKDFVFNWECMDDRNISCEYLLDTNEEGIVHANLSRYGYDYDASYSFIFTMEVTDSNNMNRDKCVSVAILEINTKEQDEEVIIKSFAVTAIATKDEINQNERVRILGDIVNENIKQLSKEGSLKYEWIEVNGLLNEEQITEYQKTVDRNSLNLILEKGVLQPGEVYLFQLQVTQYSDDGVEIGYGESPAVSISVLLPPTVLTNSLSIIPNCTAEYLNISELLSTTHSQSIYGANSENGDQLSYQFGYIKDNTSHLFSSSVLYESQLESIYLPTGQFKIFANVIDSESSITTQSIQCSISLFTHRQCLDVRQDILNYIENNTLYTTQQKYSYILQQYSIYSQYLYGYEPDDDCIETALQQIIYTLNKNLLPSDNNNDLCDTTYPITLTQIIKLCMNLITSTNELINVFYVKGYQDLDAGNMEINSLSQLKRLIYAVLDPCSFITDLPSVEDLSVSSDSIVTNVARIYYDGDDVTNEMSPIIVDPDYHDLLYEITQSIINLISHIPEDHSMDLYNLITSTLYVSELVKISLSIAGEVSFTDFGNFTIYSLRVSDQAVNATINTINVTIPEDIITRSTGLYPDENNGILSNYVDILMIGINTSSINNASLNGNELNDNCNKHQGELSSNSLSLTILGNNTNTTHLSSNINFTFVCDQDCDEASECVWYNESGDIWQTEGCITIINQEDSSMVCSCSHLTTFATIHNIHAAECEDNRFVKEWLSAKEWDYINFVLCSVFFILFCYSLIEVYPFLSHEKLKWYNHRSVMVMMLISLSAIIYLIASIFAYITKQSFANNNEGTLLHIILVDIYTFFLLIPELTFFMMFSLIMYTWFILAHGFLNRIEDHKQKLRIVLYVINIIVALFFLVYYIIAISTPFNDYIHSFGAIFWSINLVFMTFFVVVYSCLVGKVLFKAAKYTKNQSFGRDDMKIAKKLLIINSFITTYFIFSATEDVYLAIYPRELKLIYIYSRFLLYMIILICICWMYRGSMRKLVRAELDERRNSGKSKEDSDATIKSLFSRVFEGSAFKKMRNRFSINKNSTTKTPPNPIKTGKNKNNTAYPVPSATPMSTTPNTSAANSPKSGSPWLKPMSLASGTGTAGDLPKLQDFGTTESTETADTYHHENITHTADFHRISSQSANGSITRGATNRTLSPQSTNSKLGPITEVTEEKEQSVTNTNNKLKLSPEASICGRKVRFQFRTREEEEYEDDVEIMFDDVESYQSKSSRAPISAPPSQKKDHASIFDEEEEGVDDDENDRDMIEMEMMNLQVGLYGNTPNGDDDGLIMVTNDNDNDGEESQTKSKKRGSILSKSKSKSYSQHKKKDSLLDNDGNIETFNPQVSINEDDQVPKYDFMTIDKDRWNTPGLQYFTGDNEK